MMRRSFPDPPVVADAKNESGNRYQEKNPPPRWHNGHQLSGNDGPNPSPSSANIDCCNPRLKPLRSGLEASLVAAKLVGAERALHDPPIRGANDQQAHHSRG